MKKLLLTIALAGVLALGATVLASAHDMWLTVDNPQVNKALTVKVCYGHAFPGTEGTEAAKVQPVHILGAKGQVETKGDADLVYASASALGAGSYLAVGGRSPQWYTKTPEGTKDVPRNQAPGAASCIRSAKYAKAIVNLGGAAEDISKPVGQTLEIVPLANPASLKAGEPLPLQVLYEGKPLASADVKATFAGFTKEGDAFAFAAHTDKEGKVKVKVWHPGLWLVVVKKDMPFADPAQCDKDMHAATLTFEVK